MRINNVHIAGFRNFKDVLINFGEKSLVIGANDIGKTNLIYALRILLDKGLSEADLEPQESDFYVHEDTNELEIVIEFIEVDEDCVLSRMKQNVSDDAKLYLAYRAFKNPTTKKLSHEFFAGKDYASLTKIDSRYYLKVLNLKFISSRRDLFAYIRSERRNLLQEAKGSRTADEAERDSRLLGEIENSLESINSKVRDLSYIEKATDSVNGELGELSFHNTEQQVVFDTGASEPSEFVDNLRLVSRVNGKSVLIGGDGRNNQIHLALWAARNRVVSETELMEVNVFCIEEPEAHLHPHQQRKLAKYLSETLEAQVIITTHSPQITCEFPPNTVIRLYNNHPDTLAAGNGISPFIEATLIEFGYRLNAISAEVFFSSLVFLVEGPSEELFYKALARQLDEKIDLERLNISIQSVAGVGFKPYVSLLRSLKIPFVIRTDNDIFKVSRKAEYRFAGVQRALQIYEELCDENEEITTLLADRDYLTFEMKEPPFKNREVAIRFSKALEAVNIFIANVDLEHDLFQTVPDELQGYFSDFEDNEIVAEMQKSKASFMFEFIRIHPNALRNLSEVPIAKPLLRCREIVEGAE